MASVWGSVYSRYLKLYTILRYGHGIKNSTTKRNTEYEDLIPEAVENPRTLITATAIMA